MYMIIVSFLAKVWWRQIGGEYRRKTQMHPDENHPI